MPHVFTVGPYRFSFWSNKNNEPPHVHVTRDRAEVKFWLEPFVALAASHGFRADAIEKIVIQRREELLEAWHDHFGDN